MRRDSICSLKDPVAPFICTGGPCSGTVLVEMSREQPEGLQAEQYLLLCWDMSLQGCQLCICWVRLAIAWNKNCDS